jgi:CHAD domain-containing protein
MALNKERIGKSVRKIRKILKKEPRRATPHQVHDIRTHSRRLEAAVEALALDSKKNERRMLKDIREVQRRAGKVRDMDVLTLHAATLRIERIEKDQDSLVQVLEHLGVERYRYAKRLHRALRQYRRSLRHRLQRTARRFEKLIPDESTDSNGVNHVAAEAAASAMDLTGELKEPATLNKTNLHRYRLKVKDLRNVLRMGENVKEDFVKALGEVKDAIGEWHDWEELVTIADRLLEDRRNSEVLRTLKATREKKYESALALTNKMRREYLPVGGAKKGSPGGKLRRIGPVLEAAEAIAS